MPQKIMVVDDEPDLTRLVAYHLKQEGFEPVCAASGVEALKLLRGGGIALMILDIMMPGGNGLQVCRQVRSNTKTDALPIILLTALNDEGDKVLGLEMGADDYMTKPFSPKELIARVKALLRRSVREGESESAYAYRNIRVDLNRHEVHFGENPVVLTAKEFSLLAQFIINKGKVLTRDALLRSVWGYEYYGTTRTVDVHIRRLREKIPLLAEAIETLPSLGYKLIDSA